MKKIGQGWQYAVYEEGDRVRKIPHSEKEIRQILLGRDINYETGELEDYVNRLIRDRKNSIRGVQDNKVDKSLLGNPIFLDEGGYLQDKVVTLGDKIKQSKNIRESRQIIDEYISFIIKCWENGFAERTYNFTVNYGYNSRGIVLIDFGEITFSKEHVADRIKKERWKKSWSYGQVSDSLRSYYSEQMKEKLTPERLNEYWP